MDARARGARACAKESGLMTRTQTAVTAYRALLKAQREVFAGDRLALAKARSETRMRFLEHAGASADAVPGLVHDAHEAAIFLQQNVAQTVLNERGNYEMKPKAEHMYPGTEPPPFQPHDNLNK